uniref:Glucuronosyltransferase n=1 Tax=Panagrellus redivivus TaxID=6233 RepID=A0A7E4VTF9_PANRE
MFANLMIRHMPYLFYGHQIHIRNRKNAKNDGPPSDLQSFKMVLPSPKKYSIYICGVCQIMELTPELFTYFKDNLIIFYGEYLWMTNSGVTVVNLVSPDTPLYVQELHSFCATATTTTLTEPVAFSEICPFIAHCKDINLYVPVTYGASFTNIARKNRFAPVNFCALEQDMSDNVMLEMVDYFLSLPNRSSDWETRFHQSKPISLIKVVVDKIAAAGFKKGSAVASRTPFNMIRVCISKETGTFDCSFLPTVLVGSDDLTFL